MPGVPTAAKLPPTATQGRVVEDVSCFALVKIAPTNDGLSRVLNTVERKNWTLQHVQFEAGSNHHTLRLVATKRHGDADHLVRHLGREVVVIHAEQIESPCT